MDQIKSPLKAIRVACLDCCCGSKQEVNQCAVKNCALWPFRNGKNPYRAKREYTDEQKNAMRERLQNARINKK